MATVHDVPDAAAMRFAAASRTSILAYPGRSVASSTDAGWTALLLEVREVAGPGAGDAATDAATESLATPDQTLVVSLGADYELECFDRGVWRRALRQAGSAGLTPGGVTDRLRRRPRGPDPIRTAHVYLPAALFHDAVEHFRRAGAPSRSEPLAALAFRDPAVAHAVLALVRAVEGGAPDLYAAAVAQYLATHLLSRHTARGAWADGADDPRSPGLLTDRRLARVVDYMSAHFREPLALARLAAEAGVSRFHFVRLFRAATGETPHAFLIRLRLRAARQLLRDTDLGVAEVAAASGYASAAHFGRAFVRHTGRTPTAFRAEARGAGMREPGEARIARLRDR